MCRSFVRSVPSLYRRPIADPRYINYMTVPKRPFVHLMHVHEPFHSYTSRSSFGNSTVRYFFRYCISSRSYVFPHNLIRPPFTCLSLKQCFGRVDDIDARIVLISRTVGLVVFFIPILYQGSYASGTIACARFTALSRW